MSPFDHCCAWAANHPRITAALICASILVVFALDGPR